MTFRLFEIIEKFVNRKRDTTPDDLHGLEGFLKNKQWNNRVTIDEAKHNLEDSLVEIDRYKIMSVNIEDSFENIRSGRSKGFQITHDGYILTAAHCVNGQGWETKIITREGRHYPLQKVCIYNAKYDVALIKINIEDESKPRMYPFYNQIPTISTPCVCIRLDDDNVKVSGCMSKGQIASVKYKDANNNISIIEEPLMFSGDLKHGDSGSPIVTYDGHLIGMAAGYDNGDISGPHINKALDLIEQYVAQEKNIYRHE